MSNSAVAPIRSGTKALPALVFRACDRLTEEKGQFKNEDVLAITGGGMSTVARLVKTWRQHEHIITANDALTAEATITLVEMLDKLVQQQIARSQEAVEKFLNEAAQDMAELSEAYELNEHALATTQQTVNELKEERKALESDVAGLKTQLVERNTELAASRTQCDLKVNELQQVQTTFTAKLEQMTSQHQHAQSQALESQRSAMEAERNAAISRVEVQWKNEQKEALAELNEVREQLTTAREHNHVLTLKIQSLTDENQSLTQRHDEQRTLFEEVIQEKQVLITQTNRDLATAMQHQLSTTSQEVDAQISSLRQATEGVSKTLEDIQNTLKTLTPSKGGEEN